MSQPTHVRCRARFTRVLALAWGLGVGAVMASMAASGWPQVACAQSNPPAEQLFSRGLIALRSGQLAEAAEAFERAYRLDPRPATLLNLGVARTRQGRLMAALQAFQGFLRTADPVRDAANIQAVRGEIARIRATSTTLVLALTPADAVITVDGVAVPRSGNELVIPPGEHDITVSAPDHASYAQTINLPAGRFAFTLRLVPQPGAVAASPPAPAPAGITPPANAAGAPPDAAAPAVSDETVKPSREATGKPGCLFGGDACLSLQAILGVLHPLGGGVSLRLPPYFSLAAEAQWLPSVTIEGADVTSRLLSLSARAHPWRNGIFGSFGFASMRIDGTVDRAVGSGDGTFSIPSLSFGLGVASEGEGFFIGADVSILVPLYEPELQVQTNVNGLDADELRAMADPEQVARIEAEIEQAIDDVRDILPVLFQVNLIRVGYAF